MSCNQPFDPIGSVDQRLVVFTVLSTDRSVQYVRVTEPFYADGFDPSSSFNVSNAVTDALVTIQTQVTYTIDIYKRKHYILGEQLHLRDSILVSNEPVVNTAPFHVYTANPFTPQHGGKYDVYVSSATHGQASGSVIIPDPPTLTIPYSTIIVLDDTPRYASDTPLKFLMTLADSVKGFVARLFIDYSVVREGEWISERVEVPVSSADRSKFGLTEATYPTLTESVGTRNRSVTFELGYLRSVVEKITAVTYAGQSVVFDKVVFMVLQSEPNLYDYVATSRLERDPHSIRLDQPPISKLNGKGYGLVGGYSLDSLVYPLSELFYGNVR